MAEFAGNPTRTSRSSRSSSSSPINLDAAYKRAGSFVESGRKYAANHPYQVILGAVGVASIGAITAYLLRNRRHH